MNGENHYVFDASARDDVHAGAWRWIVVSQVWMLAAFTGMSLCVIAALSAFHGGAGHARVELLATGCVGAVLMLLAWQGLARMLHRVERKERREVGRSPVSQP